MERFVFVSDLHLGSVAELDAFNNDIKFERLINSIIPVAGDTCELILLGDSFDFWQSVPVADCQAPDTSTISLDYSVSSTASCISTIAARHTRWFDAIKKFVSNDNCKVTFVIGNHDHVLVENGVKAALLSALGVAAASSRIAFETHYYPSGLAQRIYAEHGNQFEPDNKYENFNAFGVAGECPGYYFVRLFWNRIKYIVPELHNNGSIMRAAWWVLLKNDHDKLATALGYFAQYWDDPRVTKHISMPSAPLILVSARKIRDHKYAVDAQAEKLFMDAYISSLAVRETVDRIKARPEALRAATQALPIETFDDMTGPPPSDIEYANKISTEGGSFRSFHEPCRFVLLGHTHGERCINLDSGAVYINTGSWSRDNKFPVAFIENDHGTMRHRIEILG